MIDPGMYSFARRGRTRPAHRVRRVSRRSAPLGRLLIPAGVAAALGCQSGPIEFSDTEGRVFVAECSDRGCTHRRKASGEGAPATAVTLEQQGRLLAVCDSSDAPEPVHCRAVTCTSACPPRSDGARPTCEDGLCIQPERTLTPTDVRLLCLAGTGIGRNARQAERLALAAACTPPCEVPEACR